MTEVQGATGFMVEISQQSKLEMSFVEGVLGVQLPSGRYGAMTFRLLLILFASRHAS